MANINKIRISGTSYDIQDSNAPKVVELTQAQYDALPSTAKTSNTLFVITDAQAGDLTNYYTKTEVDNAITAATSTKQDTLVSGTNIKTINNTSLLGSGNIDIQGGGGGGKAIEAGRGIAITTGETADTINCTLPISVGTGNYLLFYNDNTNNINSSSKTGIIYGSLNGRYNPINSNNPFIIGDRNEATANSPFIHGHSCKAKGLRNFISGYKLDANYSEEAAFGHWNNSVTGSTDADKTLFSVGNGTADNARHNAFEIRQNGDIYLSSGGTDIKLQDHLGGGGSITVDSALDSNSTNPVQNKVIYNKIDEVEQVTAAGLNALNDNFGGLKLVKLTQTEYNNLQTKDNNTLYIIVN